jgi:hypothetical protein
MKANIPAEEAFIITVGVSHKRRTGDCNMALRVLRQYGFQCGPTSEDALIQLATQAKLTKQLESNDPTTNEESPS